MKQNKYLILLTLTISHNIFCEFTYLAKEHNKKIALASGISCFLSAYKAITTFKNLEEAEKSLPKLAKAIKESEDYSLKMSNSQYVYTVDRKRLYRNKELVADDNACQGLCSLYNKGRIYAFLSCLTFAGAVGMYNFN